MATKIFLVSDDNNFFYQIEENLKKRNSDVIIKITFDEVLNNLDEINNSLILVNSEECKEKTIELLKLLNNELIIVFYTTDNYSFKIECLKNGVFDYFSIYIDKKVLNLKIKNCLKLLIERRKKENYRKILNKKEIISFSNEVYKDYTFILDTELENLRKQELLTSQNLFIALSIDDKNKFIINQNTFETVLLNNLREEDIVMSFAINKYFIIMHDISLNNAEKIISKVEDYLKVNIIFGIVVIKKQMREQLINEALNKLHESINHKNVIENKTNMSSNFKVFRQELKKKYDEIITPVYYHLQQKYQNTIYNSKLTVDINSEEKIFKIEYKNVKATFIITTPGFDKINIDISFYKNNRQELNNRISYNNNEFEAGILEDLLEQFVKEFKNKVNF